MIGGFTCSCTGVYGVKWIVCTLDDRREAFDDEDDVRVCELAVPMSRRAHSLSKSED